MRRSRNYLIVIMSIALCAVAGQVSAGQARPRSAPPSSSRGSSSQPSRPSQSGQSGRDSSRVQGQRGSAGPSRPQSSTQQQRPQVSQPQSRSDNRGYSPRGNDSRDAGRNDNRVGPQRQGVAPRQAIPAPRDRYDSRYDNRNDNRYDNRNDGRYDNRSYGGGYNNYAPSYRYSGPRIVIAPRQQRRFTSSWFSFRPQLRLSFGLTVGYPIAFPSWYDPYIVGTPGYVRPYMAYGGVSFDVDPQDAELWVDGDYVGRVSDYSPYDPPLTLVAGRHHIELTGRSYRPIEFDITVLSGQVIPYQGTLPYVR